MNDASTALPDYLTRRHFKKGATVGMLLAGLPAGRAGAAASAVPAGNDGRHDGRPPVQRDNHGQILIPDEHSITAYEGRKACDTITRLGAESKPFTLHIDFWLPHTPVVVTEKYHGMYPPEDVPLPASLDDPMDNTPYQNANGRQNLPQYADPDKIRYFISNY